MEKNIYKLSFDRHYVDWRTTLKTRLISLFFSLNITFAAMVSRQQYTYIWMQSPDRCLHTFCFQADIIKNRCDKLINLDYCCLKIDQALINRRLMETKRNNKKKRPPHLKLPLFHIVTPKLNWNWPTNDVWECVSNQFRWLQQFVWRSLNNIWCEQTVYEFKALPA